VLRLLSEGRSNREISQMLGIAEGTVKVHVNAAFRVLGVHNRVSATVAFREFPTF
jgi:two-component system, NarL family, nitrate/nitrite response regulator NarL